jgi:hypothetical protein
MGTKVLHQPREVRNVDGTPNRAGSITHYCNLWVRQGSKKVQMGFYVANLGRDRLILGHPWFRNFNPVIDWVHNMLTGDKVHIETAGYLSKKGNPISELNTAQSPETTPTNQRPVPNLLTEYQRHTLIFSETTRFPPARLEDLAITLLPTAPTAMNCKIYPLTAKQTDYLRSFLKEHLEKQYIEVATSPYGSPVFFRKKSDDSDELRLIIDYRELNSHTVRDAFPQPLIDVILSSLQGKKLFTKFDICWGFNNIRIREEDRWKAAFKTPFGLFQPRVMYFGLTNSPATFCRVMNRIFRRLLDKYPLELFVYIDDILIATGNDLQRHRQIVHEVLDVLEEEDFYLKLSKCAFEQTTLTYLGIVISGDKITIDPAKADGLKNWPRNLTSVKQVRSVLGVLGYQRPFIPNFANIARPLTYLLRKDSPFLWTEECCHTLDTLITTVTSNPSIGQPDMSKPFQLEVDTSAFATGAILTQKDERGKPQAVGYHSQTFNDAERNYNIHDRELLAVVRGLDNWRHLLAGSPLPITVLTDHKNLQYYRQPHRISRRVARYLPRLADYNFILTHQPGNINKADALSRRPDHHTGDNDNDDILVLPPSLFVDAITSSSLDDRVRTHQLRRPKLLAKWTLTHNLSVTEGLHWCGAQLVVVDDNTLRRGVISLYHNSITAGHPGITKTLWAIRLDYWWPNMKNSITNYIKGCAMCQSRKNHPNNPKPPPFPITTNPQANPFEVIALDFITKLPISSGYNTILTITDHDCSKAAIFIPCNEAIDVEHTALLYATYVLCYVHHRRLPDLGDVGMCGFFYKLQQLMTEGCK